MEIKEKFKKIDDKKTFKPKLFFFIASFIYISFSYIFFLQDFKGNDVLNSGFKYISHIFVNLQKNFEEKNLSIKFENNTFQSNIEEPILLENYDKRITNYKNLLYISKDASDKDFKEKDTLMILNSKELKVNLGPDPLIYPIENIRDIRSEISKDDLKNLNEKFYPGSEYYNAAALNILVVIKGIEILLLLIVCVLLLPYLVYLVLSISGYKNLNMQDFKGSAFIALGIYLIAKPVFITFVFEPSIISVILILAVIISILEKRKLEKN